MIETVAIPLDMPTRQVELRYLADYDGPQDKRTSLAYLHKHRVIESRAVDQYLSSWRASYDNDLPRHRADFRNLIAGIDPDIIVVAPSRYQDSLPYVEEAKHLYPTVDVLREAFAKATSAGRAKTWDEFYEGFRSMLPNRLWYSRPLIIDDSLAKGYTAYSMLEELARVGVVTEHAVLAVALRIRWEKQPNPRALRRIM